jgi:hypothetical protein
VHQGVPLQTCHLRESGEAAPLQFTRLSGVAPNCPVCQAEQRSFAPTVVCNATVNSEQCNCVHRSQSRRQKAHRTVNRTCLVHHRTVRWPRCQKLQRPGDVAGAPDSPVRHTIAAFPNGQFGGWGYKYPQPPHFNASKFLAIKPHTRALDFIPRHKQIDQILSQSPESLQTN